MARPLSRPAIVLGAVALAAAALAGCSTAGRALGMGKTVPDEWRTVAKAPLVIPPDFARRCWSPRPACPRPTP